MANRIGRCSASVRRFSFSSRSGIGSYDWPKGRSKAFPDVYNSANVENGWYEWWEKNNFFKPSTISNSTKCQQTAVSKKDDEKFSLILPPPNVTGTLHLGHALTITVQDIVTRWHRMRGLEAVWVPGVDHAGIATQVVVEKQLRKERNISRQDMGREQFVNEVWNWKNEKGDVISKQLRTLGASFDWSKEFFTMDDDRTKAVNEAMVRLWDSGLLFREPALVNWCCCLQSAISDIEVDDREISGPTDIEVPGYTQPVQFGLLTDFAYKLINSDEEVVVSTTRLETVMGDVAVAVHPEDPRYRSLHGATLWHPLRHIPIPLICDKDVDKDFATGAVKITPAHDATDLRIAKRHGLPIISVINEDGILNDFLHSPFSGMKRFDARNAILQELKDQDLFRGHKPHQYKLPICSRSGDVIEYILKPQWFIDCKVMSKRAAAAVKNGDLQIYPESYSKIWLSWLENIREWNISRQIWWGHQLPLCEAVPIEGDSNVSIWVVADSLADAELKSAEILNKDISKISIRQDPDVLDTWFSSALLPFSAFGWPSQTESLAKNYPLSIMVTGHDILFFWVARMVMLGLQITGRLPFKKVFLHGIVCDAQGRKMSKSLGNVINPEDIVKGVTLKDLNETVLKSCSSGLINEEEKEKALVGQKLLFPDGIPDCGTDALRFTLASQIVTKHFINFDVNECITNRSFCNKIWQAFRYVFTKISQLDVKIEEPISSSFDRISTDELNHMDRWILSRLSNAVDLMNSSLSDIELHNATAAFKQFFYHEFCDVYLETTKPILNKGLSSGSRQSINVLLFCLDNSLRMMSPFMPYLAEELNMWMPAASPTNSVMTSQFPSNLQNYEDKSLEKEVDDVLEVVTAVRRIKASHGLQHKNTKVKISSEKVDLLRKHIDLITALLRDELTITGDEIAADVNTDRNVAIEPHSYHTRIAVHLQGGATSLSEEQIQLLMKKEAKMNKTLHKLLQTISNKGFEEKAPQHVQIAQKEKVRGLQEELVTIKKKLESAGVITDESKRETG